MAIKNEMQIEYLHPNALNDYERQLRIPSKTQINKTIRLIEYCGFPQPIVIDAKNCIIIGWHFVEAARQLGIDSIPIVRADHLNHEQVRIL